MTMHEDPHGDPETYVPNPRPMIAWARRVLDEAWGDMQSSRGSEDYRSKIAAAQAMATIAQAAALLQPTPEEVLATYEEIATEVDDQAGSKLQEVHALLDEARRHGPRHPAISQAIKIIEGTP